MVSGNNSFLSFRKPDLVFISILISKYLFRHFPLKACDEETIVNSNNVVKYEKLLNIIYNIKLISVPLLDYLRDPEVQAKIETAVEVGEKK